MDVDDDPIERGCGDLAQPQGTHRGQNVPIKHTTIRLQGAGGALTGLNELRHLVKPLLRRELEEVRTGEAAATAERGELLEGVGQGLDRDTASATMALDDALSPVLPAETGPGPMADWIRRTPVRW